MFMRIKELASQRGLSIKALEETVGLGNGTIRRWDTNYPSVDKLQKVANFLNVSIDFLITGTKDDSLAISKDDQEWLALIHQLPPEAQYEFRGEIKGYLKRLSEESVAADKNIRQAK